MIVGFTGTQSGMSQFQKDTLKEILIVEKCHEFCHGDCYSADKQANDIASEIIRYITIFPPDNPSKRAWCFNQGRITESWMWTTIKTVIDSPATFDSKEELDISAILYTYRVNEIRWAPKNPYMIRNQSIVDHSDMLIACPKEADHSVRSGTWATIRMGWAKQRKNSNFKVVIIPPLSGRL